MYIFLYELQYNENKGVFQIILIDESYQGYFVNCFYQLGLNEFK